MNIILASDMQYDSIVDGEGMRTIIWTQGCPHHCIGCHNPNTHAFDKGKIVDVEDIKHFLNSMSNQDGITLSGGEPFAQPDACAEIASYAHSIGLNVWCYTGYRYEDLLSMGLENDIYMNLLSEVDILVDGKFMLDQRSLDLKYRGSSNQRIIDVKKSLAHGEVYTVDKYDSIGYQELYQKPEYMFV